MLFSSSSWLLAAGLLSSVSAGYLASTTRYFDGSEGACGCGTSAGNFPWTLGISPGVYTAAGSQALFDTDLGGWCGGGCGKCYNLTSTGGSACDGCGNGSPAGTSIIVMITNLCPYNGNNQWCPNPGSTNQHGFAYHFDIQAKSEVYGDNAVVEFEPVPCPGQASADWATCQCHGQTAKDETPAGMSIVSAVPAPPPAKSATAAPPAPSPPAPPVASGTAHHHHHHRSAGWRA